MNLIVELIDHVIRNYNKESELKKIANKVNYMMRNKDLFNF